MAEKAGVIKNPEASNEERIEELRAEIEKTRSDIHRTVSELQGRLSPSHIKEEMQDRMREATVGKARRAANRARDMGSQIFDVIRDNPFPAFLGGVGIGWLIVRAVRQGAGSEVPSTYLGRETYEEGNYAEEHQAEAGQGLYGKASEMGAQAREKAREYSEQARRKVSETTDQVAQKAQELSERAKGKASEYAERARGRAGQAKSYLSDALNNNPLGVALAVFAIGIAAGLAFPVSAKESEMGERFASKARDTAKETIEKVRSVADEAKEASKRKAKEEGLL